MFKLFGLTHLLTLIIIIAICIGFIIFLRYVSNNYDITIKNVLAISLFLSMLTHYIWAGVSGRLSFTKDIPLTLCYITAIFCIIELYLKNKTLFECLFYIMIFATCRALITPDLLHGFPHIKYFQFFTMHLLMILVLIFITMNYGFRLSFFSPLKSWTAFLGYALLIFIYNIITDSNYLYLAKKPIFKTELDYLGSWPYYFISISVLMLVLFYIIHSIYLFIQKRRHKKSCIFFRIRKNKKTVML